MRHDLIAWCYFLTPMQQQSANDVSPVSTTLLYEEQETELNLGQSCCWSSNERNMHLFNKIEHLARKWAFSDAIGGGLWGRSLNPPPNLAKQAGGFPKCIRVGLTTSRSEGIHFTI